MLKNFQIYTHNYELNLKQEKIIQNTIDAMAQKVPCNSAIHINLEYQKNKFAGNLKITTNKKVFFSSDSARTISQLLKDLNRKTTKQIRKWKSQRTQQDITGVIDIRELRDKTYMRELRDKDKTKQHFKKAS